MDVINKYRLIENLWEYVRLGVRKGILWSYILSDIQNIEYTAVEMIENIKYQHKKNTYYINEGDTVLFLNANSFKILTSENKITLNYTKNNKNDYFQAANAVNFFALAESPTKILTSASYKKYYHTKECELLAKLDELANSGNFSTEEILNTEYILEARKKGEAIDFNTLSDMGKFLVSKRLLDEGIPYGALALFYQENFKEEQEMDVEEYIKNTNDIVLITLEADRERVAEIIQNEFEHELLEKSCNVDNLSIEELLSFKSQITGYTSRADISSAMLAKMQSALSNIDKIEEQLKQEVYEKKDIYGREDKTVDDYDELVL